VGLTEEGANNMGEIGIGLVGYKFMGRAHSNGYRQVSHFFDVDPKPRMVAIAGRNEAAVSEAADQLGWEGYETDYQRLIDRSDIGVIDVSTPGDSHYQVVMSALAAGKHVLCEKPLANSLEQARVMMVAAKAAGVINMINFNYRRVPAVVLARKLIAEGRIGEVRHFRAIYLQDWILDPEFPLVWRLKKELAGSGALGDIAAHIVDLSRYLLDDEIVSVTGALNTFIKQRPVEVSSGGGAGLVATRGTEYGDVTVDDAAHFLAKFASGATGTYEVSRLAPGRRNHNQFEINGSKGTIVFDLERLNELEVYFVDDEADVQGFRKILVTDGDHPYVGSWWPSGHIIGWEHTFTHVVKDLMDGIKTGANPAPSFEDGYKCQAVLDAVERSSASGAWESPVPA
jgi:predicted dehydrogenase